jgi:hypothetical protein
VWDEELLQAMGLVQVRVQEVRRAQVPEEPKEPEFRLVEFPRRQWMGEAMLAEQGQAIPQCLGGRRGMVHTLALLAAAVERTAEGRSTRLA